MSRRGRLIVPGAAVLVQLAAFAPVYAAAGTRAGALTVLPVLVVALLWGVRPALATVAALLPANFALFAMVGADPAAAMLAEASGWIAVTLIAGIVGSLRDATTRARHEAEERRLAEERHAIILRGANDGIWEWELAPARVRFSSRWKELLGYREHEIGERPGEWLDRVHADDRARLAEQLDAVIERRRELLDCEHRLRHSDGSYRWFLVRAAAVRGADGRATRLAGSHTDITERRQIAAAQERAELLEHATRAVGLGSFICGDDGRLARVSSVMESLTSAWTSVAAWWAAASVGVDLDRLRGGVSPHVEVVDLRDPSGARRVFEITFTGSAEALGDRGVIVLVAEITARREAEERLAALHRDLVAARDAALAANRAKSTFLENMSHELRTPLNAILGYTDLILEDESAPAAVDDLIKVKRAANHLLVMIDDVLEITQVEAGRVGISIAAIDPRELALEITDAARILAEHRDNTFRLHLAEDLPELRSDPRRIRQILFNLLGNAAKFCGGGVIELGVRADADAIVFTVTDTGPGIAEEMRGRIFEAFAQVAPSRIRGDEGAGLGLTISRQLAQALGGDLEVETELGRGSAFHLRLPRQRAIGAASTPARPYAPSATAN